MPFGVRPKNSVGIRFALMELKITLVNILHEYNIFPGINIEQGMYKFYFLVLLSNSFNVVGLLL